MAAWVFQHLNPWVNHGAKAKGCQRHCVNVCSVAQHDEDTPGQGRQATTPGNDVVA